MLDRTNVNDKAMSGAQLHLSSKTETQTDGISIYNICFCTHL